MNSLFQTLEAGHDQLSADDPQLHDLLSREAQRQGEVLTLVASSSMAPPSVLVAEGLPTTNTTTEGYPGKRYHAGCDIVDQIENLAIERAKALFGASYANVQPHSGSSANQIVMFNLLEPGDTLLGMQLDAGGHLTHGAGPSVSSKYFRSISYGLDANERIDFDQVRDLALAERPKLIICGASAYTRKIDFAQFRAIADEAGAYLLADISHIAGLVVAGLHPSPIPHAHFTTTSTYKQLFGPRGGLILMGPDADAPAPSGKGTLAQLVQRGTFPAFQGTPNLSAIAAKAAALAHASRPEFNILMSRIVSTASTLADSFQSRGYRLVAGGTDNHAILISLVDSPITGWIAEKCLESAGIIINKNRVPGDTRPALVTSGIRLGTNTVALRDMGEPEMKLIAEIIDRLLKQLEVSGPRTYELPAQSLEDTQAHIQALCHQFPLPY
jgi:glycine hydroxymethyltransferase